MKQVDEYTYEYESYDEFAIDALKVFKKADEDRYNLSAPYIRTTDPRLLTNYPIWICPKATYEHRKMEMEARATVPKKLTIASIAVQVDKLGDEVGAVFEILERLVIALERLEQKVDSAIQESKHD